MSAQHTPGPWELYFDHPTADDRQSIGNIRAHNADGEPLSLEVVTVYACAASPERLANAKLIAAAPELLAALKTMLDAFVEDPLDADTDKATEQAYDAIEKALKGRTPTTEQRLIASTNALRSAIGATGYCANCDCLERGVGQCKTAEPGDEPPEPPSMGAATC